MAADRDGSCPDLICRCRGAYIVCRTRVDHRRGRFLSPIRRRVVTELPQKPSPPMFSLQKLFGKDDKFFELLEASAEEARRSVEVLNGLLSAPEQPATLQEFNAAKQADKK